MANGSEGWQVVSRRKHSTRTYLTSSHVMPIGDVQGPDSLELVRRILRTREELRGSQFWANCRDVITQAWENMRREENASKILRGGDQIADGAQLPSVLCLGLGPFASCSHARCQLAFLLLLEAELKAPISVFDPIFSTVECETLCRLGLQLIPMNEEGRHPVTGPTLAVLVHCGKALCNNFLWANWSPNNLAHILLLSNSFEMLNIRTPNRVLQRDYAHISQVLDIVEETSLDSQCPSSLPLAEAFSDTSLHRFPMASLCTRSMAFWENRLPPFYLHLDEPELVRDIQKDFFGRILCSLALLFVIGINKEMILLLQAGLAENFEQVDVSVVDCPDLQLAPFCLAAPGLCGNERIADVGGVPYLLPEPRKDKLYDLGDVLRLVGLPGGLVLGAGAASHAVLGTNAELMANIFTPPQGGKETVNNRSFSARWDGNATKLRSVAVESVLDEAKPKNEDEEHGCVLEPYNHTEFALLANLFISQGKQGKVLEVRAGVRTGASNFISCLRLALFRNYGEKPVGLGGVFVMEEGEAKLHVMPHFSSRPLHSDECLNSWLKFITVPPPLSCLSVLVSHDPALSLRLEHTHCFGPHGLGGHYHCDVTPRRVHYHGYFIPARDIYRIDRPT